MVVCLFLMEAARNFFFRISFLRSFFFLFVFLLFLCSCSSDPSESDKNYFLEGYPVGKVIVKKSRIQWENKGFRVLGEHIAFHQTLSDNSPSSFIFQKNFHFLFLSTHKREAFSFFNFISEDKVDHSSSFTDESRGTGFLARYKGKTYLITNFHVVCCFEEKKDISFIVYNPYFPPLKLEVKKIIALSVKNDIAVLELEFPPSFDEKIQLSPMTNEELSDKSVEIRGFPQSEERLILSSIPKTSQAGNLERDSLEICLLLDSQEKLTTYEGASGSPVFLRGTKKIISMVWAEKNLEESEQRVSKLYSVPIKKVIESIDSRFKCEGWKGCFLKAFQNLKRFYNLEDSFALRAVRAYAGCGGAEKKNHCEEDFFKELQGRIQNKPVKCSDSY